MSDFILEIYGEEIPSSAQSLIENQFEKLFSQLLEDNEIKYKDLLTFSTSRRVVVYVNGLDNYINSYLMHLNVHHLIKSFHFYVRNFLIYLY